MDLAESRLSKLLVVIASHIRQESEYKEKLAETIGQLQEARRETRAVMQCNVALEHELDEAQEIAVLDAAIAAGCETKIEKLEGQVRFAKFCANRRGLTIGKLTANIASVATRAKISPCELDDAAEG